MRKQILMLGLSCCLVMGSRAIAQASFLGPIAERMPVTEAPPPAEEKQPITLPAGTHLLMRLTSALHTTSATPGSGVYLETVFPVIAGDRVVIPEHTRVTGEVERERRPGRVNGRAQMRMRFTQFIRPDDRILALAGTLQRFPC